MKLLSFLGVLLLGAWGCSKGSQERCELHQEPVGDRCEDRCEPGEMLQGTRCIPACSSDEMLMGDRCVPVCKRDEERDQRDPLSCLPRCGDGKERFEGQCVASCGPAEQRVKGECVGPSPVRVNSVGYPITAEKVAVISGRAARFKVVQAENDELVLEGTATGPVRNTDTDEDLWFADFSSLDQAGEYVVEVEEVGRSPAFFISDDVYSEALELTMLGFYGLRCGAEVSFEYRGDTFSHGACHLEDAHVSLSSDERVDSVGGWHDAGDYGKYVLNGAFSVGMLLMAWEHFESSLRALELDELPEHGGETPDFLDEVRWELDWLLTMQRDDGAVAHKLTAANFSGFILPTADTSRRAMAPISAEATASFVAVMAMAARAYEAFDSAFSARCLKAAELGFEFLTQNPSLPKVDLSGFSTGEYISRSDDDRLWAAAELWVTTGNAQALQAFEASFANFEVRANWDWADLANLGIFSYVLSSREGRSDAVVSSLTESVLASALTLTSTTQEHGYGRAIGDHYNWGGNGSVARSVMNLSVASRLDPDGEYRGAALQQLNHLFGVNVFARSQVTGLGQLPPLHPHHRPSGADGIAAPWPGLLVGGPNPFAAAADLGFDISVPAAAWDDVEESYWGNEIAINWNAALIYALAWFAPERP